MEPRPDVRGKADLHPTAPPYETWPQWSPGLMAGGSWGYKTRAADTGG